MCEECVGLWLVREDEPYIRLPKFTDNAVFQSFHYGEKNCKFFSQKCLQFLRKPCIMLLRRLI